MKVVSSYGVKIKKQNIPIRHTLYIYRQAVGYLIRVYEESWEELSRIVNPQKRFNAAGSSYFAIHIHRIAFIVLILKRSLLIKISHRNIQFSFICTG